MAGGISQLVAYGNQDAYLTNNPEITFFKVQFRRYTPFAIESIEQTFNGTTNFGSKVTATVARNADMIWKTYLQVTLPALTASTGTVRWVDNVGHMLISEVTLMIGGQVIDRHYGDWLNIWNELTQTGSKEEGYTEMIGGSTDLVQAASSIDAATIYVPLQFWFCKNPGLALPLIALQYHDVQFAITFNTASNLIIGSYSGTPSITQASLWVDYIFLASEERRKFAQSKHEYLIEQLQYTGSESISSTQWKSKLSLNQPVKELVWVVQPQSNMDAKLWSTYAQSDGTDPMVEAKLTINGQDRFAVRYAGYFNKVQPYQHHSRIPDVGIYVYSFATEPESVQPTGTCNFSRIDNPTLSMTLATSNTLNLRVYAVNYNVLRIQSGLGGLAFSA